MQPANSCLVVHMKGGLYLTSSTKSSDLVNIQVRTYNSGDDIPKGSAVFEDLKGKYFATPNDYLPLCGSCGTPPENVDAQSPVVLGEWISGKLDFFGRRLSLLSKTPGIMALPQTHERFFSVLRIIDQKTPEWVAELSKTSLCLHYPKRSLALSVIVDRDSRIYMGLSQTVCRAQKKTDLVLETTQGTVFISQKVNKKHPKLSVDVLREIFNAEVKTYKTLLEKKAKGACLDGVLLPERMLEYGKDIKLIFERKPQNLKDRMKTRAFTASEHPKVIYGIISSLLNLQEGAEINHADIKPKNFLIDALNNIYAIDLGLINPRGKAEVTRVKGTLGFIPPELFKKLPFVADFDKWSAWCLGLVLLWVLQGKPLIHKLNKTPRNYQAMIQQLEFLQKADIHPKYDSMIKGLMKEIPDERMTIKEAFAVASLHYKP